MRVTALREVCCSALLALMLVSCASLNESYRQEAATLHSGLEMTAVEIKSGHPKGSESLESILGDPKEYFLSALKRDAKIIKDYSRVKFEVLGFTDDIECIDNQCRDLSIRRARLVYDWLISNGIAPASLKPPVGHGSEMPIADNGTDEGREKNRRVEINVSVD